MAKVNSQGWIKSDDPMISNHWRLLLGYRPVFQMPDPAVAEVEPLSPQEITQPPIQTQPTPPAPPPPAVPPPPEAAAPEQGPEAAQGQEPNPEVEDIWRQA